MPTSSLPVAIISDPRYKGHRPGAGHPECPERIDAVLAGVADAVPANALLYTPPRMATEDDVMLCHTADYIRIVQEDVKDPVCCLRTGDVDLCPESYDVAMLAAGGGLKAADVVMSGRVSHAFCVLRPPGHHASADCGTGFCVFNNVAITARYLQKKHGLERIAIVDWDVHHGNGTQDVFYDDPSVLYFSIHQWPLFPGTGQRHQQGTDAGRGFTVNCPFAMGAGRHEILGAFREKLLPAVRTFEPQCILISAGFDAHIRDPFAGFCLQARDFYDLTAIITETADQYANGRVISFLEGGYDLSALRANACAHVQQLAGHDFVVEG